MYLFAGLRQSFQDSLEDGTKTPPIAHDSSTVVVLGAGAVRVHVHRTNQFGPLCGLKTEFVKSTKWSGFRLGPLTTNPAANRDSAAVVGKR